MLGKGLENAKHGLASTTPDDSAAQRAQQWLRGQPLATQFTVQHAKPEALEKLLARPNPFQLPGCIVPAGVAAKPRPNTGRCTELGLAADWDSLVPAAPALGGQLAGLRQPGSSSERLSSAAVSTAQPDLQITLRQGPDLVLTLDPQAQRQAQDLLQRLTGVRPEPLPALAKRFADFAEAARARRLGLLVVDLASGGIEVAASSHSPCYAAWHGRQGAAPGDCLAMPGQLRPNPLNLGNTALYADAMPGSLAKLMEGLTLLETGTAAADLAPELLRSDTEAVIDRLLCEARHFDLHCANAHLAHLARRAAALGPAQIDLLAPIASPSPSPGHSAHPVFGSRLLVEPDFPGLAWEPLDNAAAVRARHQAGAKARWRGCQGQALVDTISELYGQGHARTTPAGVAAQWLSLARLANRHQYPGQVSTAPAMPHLARPAVPTRAARAAPDSSAIPSAAATLLDILALGHVSGTSHSACRAAQAYASAPGLALNCKASEPGLRIAQKTGTPVWSADKLTQAQWLKACAALAPKPKPGPGHGQRAAQVHNAALTACRLSPIKWWAAAVGDERGWHKVVVVLAERNWRRSGRIDAAGDIGPNVAAEAGLAFIQGQAPAWRAANWHEAPIGTKPHVALTPIRH